MPVTTTPAINLLPVTRTRTPWRWEAAKDRRKLKGINRRYLRPLKSATAADVFIRTTMKSCIKKHPTHLDQRLLRLTKLKNALLIWSSFGGLQGLWSGFVRCLCAFSWLFHWQYWLPWPTSATGDSLEQEKTSVINTVYRRCRCHRSEITKKPKIYRRCQWYRWKIVYRCHWHHW